MDGEEIDALLRTARDQLTRAESDFKNGFYDSCALFSALCAENSTSALILALGSKPSRKHRNWYVLRIIPKPREHGASISGLLEILKSIEEHIIRARYPLKNENGRFIIPSEYYDKKKAEKILEEAGIMLERIEALVNTVLSRKL